jgi:hypothetical protein
LLEDRFSAEPKQPVLTQDHQPADFLSAQPADETPQAFLGVVHARAEVRHDIDVLPASAGAFDPESFDLESQGLSSGRESTPAHMRPSRAASQLRPFA